MYKKLFESIKIRGLTLKNRIIFAPLGTHLSSERYKAFHVERAKGGAAMNVLGIMNVDPEIAMPNSWGIYRDDLIPQLTDLVHAVHVHGGKIMGQLNHPGRKISIQNISMYPVSASSIPSPLRGAWGIPRTMSTNEIEKYKEMFAEGARRAKTAGFDAVQLHGAHGYLVWSFLSPLANRRVDKYGGSPEDRARFACEIVERVREQVGEDYPIMIRINGSDYRPGGITIEEAKIHARLLEEAGVDAINVSVGMTSRLITGEYMVPAMSTPKGCNVPLSAEIKKVVKIPVSVAGRIDNPTLADKILVEGQADLVDIGRSLIADPAFPKKALAGRADTIRPCIACIWCEDNTASGVPIECSVNPLVGNEWQHHFDLVEKPKKVLVVGGGPAGMEAARVAKLRGHNVLLYEKAKELGGQLRLAAIPPYKEVMQDLIQYYTTTLAQLGVQVKLGHEVTRNSILELKLDHIIIAVGAVPFIRKIPGADLANVVTASDVLTGKARVGKRVVIVGGNYISCQIADFLSDMNKKVIIVESREDLAMLLYKHKGVIHRGMNEMLLLRRISEKGVKILLKTKLEVITHDHVVVRRMNQKQRILTDTVVFCYYQPNRKPLKEFENLLPISVVGDCVAVRNIYSAIHESFMLVKNI